MDCSTDNICKEFEECIYSHAEQKSICACREGTIRNEEGSCKEEAETWCGGGKCVEHASCRYDPQYEVHYCQCDAEYLGDGITECKPRPVGCDQLNNCGLHASCLYDNQQSMYTCQCNDGFYGDGFVCSTQRTCQTDPYMCDENARCVVNNDRTHVCECKPGIY